MRHEAGAGRVRRSRRVRGLPAPDWPGLEDWRDWAGDVPVEVLAKVASRVAAAEARGHGLTLMAVTCKGWKETLKQDAIARAGGPEVWRDWGNRYGEGLPATVLAKVAGKVVAQTEAGWAAYLKRQGHTNVWTGLMRGLNLQGKIQVEMKVRKRNGNCLFVFARVCREWRKAQLKVGGRLRTRVESDVILPGRVALLKWALAEGCPRDDGTDVCRTMARVAAHFGNLDLVRWLCGEGGFAMDEEVMRAAAMSGNLELVQWLRGEGCPWDNKTCWDAVCKGHVEVLRWARENGCPWTAETRDYAAKDLGYTDDLGNLVDLWGDPVQSSPVHYLI